MTTPISYLVSTAGHAQYQNEQYPHDILSVNQLIREGAQELGDRPVVGFAKPEVDEEGKEKKDEQGRIIWESQRFCKSRPALSNIPPRGPSSRHIDPQRSGTSCDYQLYMQSS
jgi:hypothetical protein